MTITIDRTGPGDVRAVAALFDAYRVFYGQPSDIERARAFIADRLAAGESVIFHARTDDAQVIGFTQLYPFFTSVHTRRLWVLNDLYVSAQARGRGVGRLLLDQARDFARETGARGILLETDVTNSGAQRLYESLGYEKQDSTFHYLLALDTKAGSA